MNVQSTGNSYVGLLRPAWFAVMTVTAARVRGWPLTGRGCHGWSRGGWGCGYVPEPLGLTTAAYSGS